MKRSWPFVFVLGFALLVSGCGVDQGEFANHVAAYSALQQDHDVLKSELQQWAADITAWGSTTHDVICDIVAKNPPTSAYSSTTLTYCGNTEQNGEPPDPPDFGT